MHLGREKGSLNSPTLVPSRVGFCFEFSIPSGASAIFHIRVLLASTFSFSLATACCSHFIGERTSLLPILALGIFDTFRLKTHRTGAEMSLVSRFGPYPRRITALGFLLLGAIATLWIASVTGNLTLSALAGFLTLVASAALGSMGIELGKFLLPRFFSQTTQLKTHETLTFDEVFRTCSVDNIARELNIQFAALPYISRIDPTPHDDKNVLFTGNPGVGKTREAIEFVRSLEADGRPVVVVLPRRFPVFAPRFISEEITHKLVVLFLDDVQRAYNIIENETESAGNFQRIIDLFSNYSDSCIVATLRNSETSKVAPLSSGVWKSFRRVEVPPLNKDDTAKLVDALAQYTSVTLDPEAKQILVGENPGTFADFVAFFNSRETKSRVTKPIALQFSPRFWQRHVYPGLPLEARVLFQSLALVRETNMSPTKSIVIQLAESMLPRTVLRPRRKVSSALQTQIANGPLALGADEKIICHDFYLDISKTKEISPGQITTLLFRVTQEPRADKVPMADRGLQLNSSARSDALGSLVNLAVWLWRRGRQDESLKVIGRLTQTAKDSWLRGTLINVLAVMYESRSGPVQGLCDKLLRSRKDTARGIAVATSYEIGYLRPMKAALSDRRIDVRELATWYTFFTWWRFQRAGDAISACQVLQDIAADIIGPLGIPNVRRLASLVDITLWAVDSYSQDKAVLSSLWDVWRGIIRRIPLFAEPAPRMFRTFRRLFIERILVPVAAERVILLFRGADQLYSSTVGYGIMSEWFHLSPEDRRQWCDYLSYVEPTNGDIRGIAHDLLVFIETRRPMFATLVSVILAMRIINQFDEAIAACSYLYEHGNDSTKYFVIAGLVFASKLCRDSSSLREIDRMLLSYLPALWKKEDGYFPDAHMVIVPTIELQYKIHGHMGLVEELIDSVPKDDTRREIRLMSIVRSLGQVALDGYTEEALKILSHWPTNEEAVHREVLQWLAKIRMLQPKAVDQFVADIQSPDATQNGIVEMRGSAETPRLWGGGAFLMVPILESPELRRSFIRLFQTDLIPSRDLHEAMRLIVRDAVNMLAASVKRVN